MDKKIFNPEDWLNPGARQLPQDESISNTNKAHIQVEEIIQQIEAEKIDIASAYSDWRNIGFALADEFGEGGREYFHRISRPYADYSPAECDMQFTNCLKARGQGISMATLYFLAKNAGISLTTSKPVQNPVIEEMPTLPDDIFPQLPEFLQKVVAHSTSKEERDLLLLGSIVAISSCLPNIYGIYDSRKVFANLYLFVTAQASAGKGRLVHCRQLVEQVHKALREQARLLKQQYDMEMVEYAMKKGKDEGMEKPQKPQEKMLLIPANNSTTGVFQLLNDNDGKGLIFETEGDTLSQAFKSDYGNYSDGFRKAFHHEAISYFRRTDREYVDIESPCLSTVLSGTPKQVAALIPSAENGLFSRFIFYFMNVKAVWKDVFADSSDTGLDEYFNQLGNQFHQLYQMLSSSPEIKFDLSIEQRHRFNTFFTEVQDKYIIIQGEDYMATVRRLGLIAFRIAMILSALRIMKNGDISPGITCEDRDFQSALSMVSVLVKHSSKVYSELPEEEKPPIRKNRKEKFLDSLPQNFNRKKYLEVANCLEIPVKTAEGYITKFVSKGLVHREQQDHYINLSIPETKDSEEVKG